MTINVSEDNHIFGVVTEKKYAIIVAKVNNDVTPVLAHGSYSNAPWEQYVKMDGFAKIKVDRIISKLHSLQDCVNGFNLTLDEAKKSVLEMYK